MNLKIDAQKIIILVAIALCTGLGVGLGLTIAKNHDLEGKLSVAREEGLANEATIATLTKDGKSLEGTSNNSPKIFPQHVSLGLR